MNSEVLLLGVIVGSVNYLFRYLPLRLRADADRLPGAGGRLLENPQHYCPDAAVGVGLWSGMENHQRTLSFTYQF